MSSAIADALVKSNANYSVGFNKGLQLKASFPGIDFSSTSGIHQLNQFGNQAANKRNYALFRGWVYAAINAIALEGSSQSPNVGRLTNSAHGNSERSNPGLTKSYVDMLKRLHQKNMMCPHIVSSVPNRIADKAARQELEVFSEHPLLDVMEKPNSFQHSTEFAYSFIASLTLTGWGYIIGGETEDGKLEFFSIPTTWVTPIHKKGTFSQFKIKNPNNPSDQKGIILERENVAFAYLPNPSDPLSALSPATAESAAIKIDDNIQSSQTRFFGNSIFPSHIITIGNNPHPDVVGGGIRPRLTAAQKRQIRGAINKEMGIVQYGAPAIIDGMIERIDRLSMTQTEMGWEKSEKTIRTRILSAFGVHPFILGEEIVGSYAQAYVVRDIFCQRVNVYLNLLSTIMSEFAGGMIDELEKLIVWWDECQAKDPQLEERKMSNARKREDISQNELRAWLGFPPDEDRNESNLSNQVIKSVTDMAERATNGKITVEQAQGILISMGLPTEDAIGIAGEGVVKPEVDDEVIVEEEGESEHNSDHEEITRHIADMSKSYSDSIEDIQGKINNHIEQQKSQVEDVKVASSQMKADVLLVLNQISQESNRKEELSELGSIITKSFDAIADSIKTPSVINIEPTDIQFSPQIDVAAPEVSITNDIPATIVNVETPQIKSPEIVIEVKPADVSMPDIHVNPEIVVQAPNVNIESTEINVAAPNVEITNKIDVDVPQTEVNVTREGAPKKAEIRHPDGRISQIELKE